MTNMNEYKYNELQPGHTETFKVDVTEEKVEAFLKVSEDTNPLHTDEDFAKNEGYKDKVVYGMMTAALFSKLGGYFSQGSTACSWNVMSNLINRYTLVTHLQYQARL